MIRYKQRRRNKNTPATTALKCCSTLVLVYLSGWPSGQPQLLSPKRNSNDECNYRGSSYILEPKTGLGGEREYIYIYIICIYVHIYIYIYIHTHVARPSVPGGSRTARASVRPGRNASIAAAPFDNSFLISSSIPTTSSLEDTK